MTHLAFVTPAPEDVQQAVSAVTQACRDWKKVPVDDVRPPIPRVSNEEMVCSYINNPSGQAWMIFDITVCLMLIAFAVLLTLRLHRLPSLIFRIARRAVKGRASA